MCVLPQKWPSGGVTFHFVHHIGIDDALAIFAALESHLRGEIQILGISLVSGNTHVKNQVSNVLRILSTVPECLGNVSTHCK